MNFHMRLLGVAGVLSLRVSYPAMSITSLALEDYDWQSSTSWMGFLLPYQMV
jgi:hypothetical protein